MSDKTHEQLISAGWVKKGSRWQSPNGGQSVSESRALHLLKAKSQTKQPNAN